MQTLNLKCFTKTNTPVFKGYYPMKTGVFCCILTGGYRIRPYENSVLAVNWGNTIITNYALRITNYELRIIFLAVFRFKLFVLFFVNIGICRYHRERINIVFIYSAVNVILRYRNNDARK